VTRGGSEHPRRRGCQDDEQEEPARSGADAVRDAFGSHEEVSGADRELAAFQQENPSPSTTW
jgi:hypothetical protein